MRTDAVWPKACRGRDKGQIQRRPFPPLLKLAVYRGQSPLLAALIAVISGRCMEAL